MYLVLFQWYKVDIFSDKKWTQTTDCEKIPSDDMTAAKMHFLETTQSIMHNIVCIIVA